jgi:hypothetical protein
LWRVACYKALDWPSLSFTKRAIVQVLFDRLGQSALVATCPCKLQANL